MGVYYATIVSTYICALMSKLSDKKKYRLLRVFWIVLAAIIIILFSGLRSGIGDTYFYEHTFNQLVQNPGFANMDRDPGFVVLNLIIIQFTENPQVLLFVCALITNAINIFVINKYRSSIELSIFMYITAGYLTTSMNGIRQCLAASLVFLCTPLLLKRKTIPYIVCMVIISTIHQSALFMIPIYFIAGMKTWTKEFYAFIILACIGILAYNKLSPYIFGALQNTQYGDYAEFQEGGSTFTRVVVNMAPIILAYYKRDALKEKFPGSDIFINIALLNCVFVGFGMWNWIFNRFSLYLQLYNFILLPFIISECLEGKEKRLVYFLFITCYLFFFYREHVIGYHMNYKSIVDINKLLYFNTK